ncbi:MAG TPA: NADH-ubiquinone oxidoreductase-F iron-sulfur binding region domain-containing protein [Actinophytocola sp.]|uniref:NADH-ubiquinone oxidoreductase-F iron-sulfur binding region domain-containing protein n=1 Tax=Actinophytocola sp. TaxID=1872138 RepID=UPI002E0B497E|nr:NADH-ubiquinone oxidoreductase-F iron-sulfur binding region domain-containing protein [Actinophytocola sp.]
MTIIEESPSNTRISRLLSAAAADLDQHHAISGPVPWRKGTGKLIGDVQAAGLTGRGGAGFPTWRKLAALATAEKPVVIANGAEGEPASTKDAALLTRAPHLVLDGLQLIAETVGATAVYLYVKPGPAADSARAVLAERAAKRWDRYPVRVVEADRTFIAGEESAVIAKISGRRALPFDKRRLIVHSGLNGRATLVQNVETLAHLGQIARNGPDWFRRLGTAEEPGTFLATVGGPVARPGVYEVPIGIPISALLELAGGATEPAQATLIGGYHGTWLPYGALGHTPLSRAALAPLGGSPGAGVVLALPRSRCGLRETATIVRYLAAQSARQCGPCRNGLPAMAALFDDLAQGRGGPGSVAGLHELSTVVRGACHHPDGSARLVRSALDTFDAEVRLHLTGRCSAGDPR